MCVCECEGSCSGSAFHAGIALRLAPLGTCRRIFKLIHLEC